MRLHPLLKAYELFKNFLTSDVSIGSVEDKLSKLYGKTAILLSSARTGLYLSLASKGLKRTDEIYVPNYLSQCVLNTINKTAFPSHSQTSNTKAILVLHQWGYPQKMDEIIEVAKQKEYLIIEDCAHSMTSKYKRKNIGLLSDAAIFSFPKLFPTVMGGFLLTNDEEIINYTLKYRGSRSDLWRSISLNRMMWTVYKNQSERDDKRSESLRQSLEKCYSVYPDYPQLTGTLTKMISKAIQNLTDLQKREENLMIYKSRFPENYIDKIEENSTVVPYFVPFFDSVMGLQKIVGELNKNGIESSIMHFDVNRNIFDSNYQNCLALPCHQGLSQNEITYICDLITCIRRRD